LTLAQDRAETAVRPEDDEVPRVAERGADVGPLDPHLALLLPVLEVVASDRQGRRLTNRHEGDERAAEQTEPTQDAEGPGQRQRLDEPDQPGHRQRCRLDQVGETAGQAGGEPAEHEACRQHAEAEADGERRWLAHVRGCHGSIIRASALLIQRPLPPEQR
jgi:hypothetical protein